MNINKIKKEEKIIQMTFLALTKTRKKRKRFTKRRKNFLAENQGEVHDSVQAFFILFVSALALFQILISSFSSFFILFFYPPVTIMHVDEHHAPSSQKKRSSMIYG